MGVFSGSSGGPEIHWDDEGFVRIIVSDFTRLVFRRFVLVIRLKLGVQFRSIIRSRRYVSDTRSSSAPRVLLRGTVIPRNAAALAQYTMQ